MILTRRLLGVVVTEVRSGPFVLQRSIFKYSTVPAVQHLEAVKNYFKDDFNLYNKLDLIKSLSRDNSQLRIGVITNELRNKKFLETLLVDPFDSKNWYKDLKQRDLTKNNAIRIGAYNELEIQDELDVYDIPASTINDKLEIKNIEFLEINSHIRKDEAKIDGAGTLVKESSLEATAGNNFGCHLYIFVKSSSFEELPNDERFINWPIITILNTTGQSAMSSDLIVDLDAANKANELLIESTTQSSSYLDLILQSNFSTLIQSLNRILVPEFALQQLTNSVIDQLYSQLSFQQAPSGPYTRISATNYYRTNLQKLDDLQIEADRQVSDWERDSHLELQQSVKTYCDKLTNPSFGEIVKILFKIDDLNVIYENQILTHGFLTKSERNFNHLVGKFGYNTEVVNAYDNLKQELALEKLPFLQNNIHDQILKNFALIQLPTIAVCTAFHIFYNFEINTLMAIVSFGFVLSLNNISKNVLNEFKNFNTWYMTKIRECIGENSNTLRHLLKNKFDNDKMVLKDKYDTVKGLEVYSSKKKCEPR